MKQNYHFQPLDDLNASHYFIISAGMPHSYHSDEQNPWSISWIHFAGRKATFYSRFACHALSIERIKASRINDRIDLFSEIFRNLDRAFSIEALEYVTCRVQEEKRLMRGCVKINLQKCADM